MVQGHIYPHHQIFSIPVILHLKHQDVLGNSEIELDWMFKLSFAYDIVNVSMMFQCSILHCIILSRFLVCISTRKFLIWKQTGPKVRLYIVVCSVQGMEYIHKSSLKSHGNLRPSTCLVDSRLQIKLSGFGLWEFKHGTKHKMIPLEDSNYEEMYYTAPEFLREICYPFNGTHKGDVFSFAIIMRELIYSTEVGPYHDVHLEPKGNACVVFINIYQSCCHHGNQLSIPLQVWPFRVCLFFIH